MSFTQHCRSTGGGNGEGHWLVLDIAACRPFIIYSLFVVIVIIIFRISLLVLVVVVVVVHLVLL